MLKNIRKIFGRKYLPLNKITISKSALVDNYKILSSLNNKIKIAPVLKSNAYGHGITGIAKILEKLTPPMICVDSLYEAYELQNAGVKTQILVMGYINPENLKVKKLPFAYAAYDIGLLKVIAKYQNGSDVHLKVDTGMNRLGIKINDLDKFLVEAKKIPNFKINGLMSHFAKSDPKSAITKQQINNFKRARKIFQKHKISPKWIHIAASDGFLDFAEEIGEVSNLARCGIALYGIHGQAEKIGIKPLLKLTSQIVQIKSINKGEKIGYNGTFQAKKKMIIGMLPIGYNDGIDRRLSNKGCATYKNKACRILGKVSMNITAIDLTYTKNPLLGGEVVIFSDNSKDQNSFENAAKTCNTIAHDLLIHLHPTSIKREFA
jgi:alanine racemase